MKGNNIEKESTSKSMQAIEHIAGTKSHVLQAGIEPAAIRICHDR